jgi:hypothetical protein
MTDRLADTLDAAADQLTTVDRSVPALAVPPGVFGAADAGVPGHLGRDLHAHWQAVLTARSHEAAATAARLAALAEALRTTTQAYADVDASAAHHVHRSTR